MNRGRPRKATQRHPSRGGAEPTSKTLNIKSPNVYEKAARLADLTGATMTSAIEAALEEALARHEAEVQDKIERITALARDVKKHLPPGLTREQIDREMYDEYGLPR
jgi:antitoxin VapB